MTNLQITLMSFLITSIFGVVVLFSAWIFRTIVKYHSFNGVDTDSTNRFIKAQTFFGKISMTYIFKCNKTGKQRMGVATWILLCHYIQVIFFLIFIVITWNDVILYISYPQGAGGIMRVLTDTYLLDFAMIIILGSLPVGLVIILPFMILTKNKLEERSEPLETARWERLFVRIFKLAFPK